MQLVLGIEDPFSSLSHLAGAIACATVYMRGPRPVLLRSPLDLFCCTCVMLLILSGVYHLLPLRTLERDIFQRLDHAAIFIFIAATFTSVHLYELEGFWQRVPLAVIWPLAILGLACKMIYFSAFPEGLGVAIYLGLGWLGLFTMFHLVRRRGLAHVRVLFAGCIFYSLGAICELVEAPLLLPGVIGPHEVLHMAVLMGMACHWSFVWQSAARAELWHCAELARVRID